MQCTMVTVTFRHTQYTLFITFLAPSPHAPCVDFDLLTVDPRMYENIKKNTKETKIKMIILCLYLNKSKKILSNTKKLLSNVINLQKTNLTKKIWRENIKRQILGRSRTDDARGARVAHAADVTSTRRDKLPRDPITSSHLRLHSQLSN